MSINLQDDSIRGVESVLSRMREGCAAKTDQQLADALETPLGTLKQWRYRRAIPYMVVHTFAAKYNLSLDWVFWGMEPKTKGIILKNDSGGQSLVSKDGVVEDYLPKDIIRPTPKPQISSGLKQSNVFDHFVIIPRYGSSDDNPSSNGVPLKKNILEKSGRLNHYSLGAVEAAGDSMSPTLFDGDTVIFDLDATVVTVDDIYLFEMEGFIHIKRLRRMPGNKIEVISDNPKYKPFIISERDPGIGFIVRGRFFWRGGSQI